MRLAVVTICSGNQYEKIGKTTHPTLKAYADRIGADFFVWTETGRRPVPAYKKLDVGVMLGAYDRVLYIDTDIIIRPDAPNIFDVVPEDSVGVFFEGRFSERVSCFLEWCQMFGIDSSGWDRRYFNSGVMVVSKGHEALFTAPPVEHNNYYEQTCLNANAFQHNIKMFGLSYKFNRMSLVDKATGEPRHASYFIHYAGAFFQLQGQPNPEDILIETIKADIKAWEDAAPTYEFKKNVAVIISGGLGDQIAAEPAARYVASTLYKNQNVVVQTHYPELFQHLKDVATIQPHGEPVPNSHNFYEMYTLKPVGTTVWDHMSHTLVQATDYSCISAFKGQIPIADRQIRLAQNGDAKASVLSKINNLDAEKLVVLHPGKGWPSKTLPAPFWNKTIELLVAAGVAVVVVGQTIDDNHGYVEIDSAGALDLRNQLSISETVELIRLSKVLITNDSSPVHMAGDSDCWIGLIATCKHPDYILPYRNGSQYYKAKNLERQPMYLDYDRQPSAENSYINLCTEARMQESVPKPEDVLSFVAESLIPAKTAQQ